MILFLIDAATQINHKDHTPYVWIIGGLGAGLVLIVLSFILCVFLRSSNHFAGTRGNLAKDPDGRISYKFHILPKPSFCCGSGRYMCGKSEDWNQPNGETSNHQITIPKSCNIAGKTLPVFKYAKRKVEKKNKKPYA